MADNRDRQTAPGIDRRPEMGDTVSTATASLAGENDDLIVGQQKIRAPSAPTAEALRNRLLSPRQKMARPATHSVYSSGSPATTRHPVSVGFNLADNEPVFGAATLLAQQDFAPHSWNISTFQTVTAAAPDSPNNRTDYFGGILESSLPAGHLSLSSRLLMSSKSQNANTTATSSRLQKPDATKRHYARHMGSIPTSPGSLRPRLQTVDDVMQYFMSNATSDELQYVHVMSRFNLEKVRKVDFYDLVVVGVPEKNESFQQLVYRGCRLEPLANYGPKLMQLSRKGLLIMDPSDSSGSQLITIPEFLREKENQRILKSMQYFGYFREYKAFNAWHLYSRRRRVNRARQKLRDETFFSHKDIVATIPKIIGSLYSMEIEIELFHFHGNNSISVAEFLNQQIKHIRHLEKEMISRVLRLGDIVVEQFQAVLQGKDHLDYVKAVIAGHPYSYLVQGGDAFIDWVKIRSVQRLQEEVRLKLENILCMAGYMVQASIGRLLHKFWKRISQFIVGVRHTSKRSTVLGHWDLEQATLQIMNPPEGSEEAGSTLSVDASVPDNSFLVNADWLEDGCHLCVDVQLGLRNGHAMVTADYLIPDNIKNLRVMIAPTKNELIEQMHLLFGALGRMLEHIPSLRYHHFVTAGRFKPPHESASHHSQNDEFDESHNSNSRGYFTKLHMNPILSKEGAITLAMNCLTQITEAYLIGSRVEHRRQKLEDAFKKLCSLNPEGLVKQLNFSLLVPKISKLMENPDLVDDCHRALVRDKGRLTSIQKLVAQLQTTERYKQYFLDIKHASGLVTSFRIAMAQLNTLCTIQRKKFFGKLPNAFLNRTKRLCEYLVYLDGYLSLTDTGLPGLIELLKKMKNYDNSSPMLDLEFEIVESIYRMLVVVEPGGGSDATRQAMSALSRSPEIQYRAFQELRGRLYATVTRGKSLLLGLLNQIKKETTEKRLELHGRIARQVEIIRDPIYLDCIQSPATIIRKLADVELPCVELQNEVKNIISTQDVLTDAHEIVGAASVILNSNEVDRFPDMTELNRLLSYRKRCWKALQQFNLLSLTFMNSKLGKCDVKGIALEVDSIADSIVVLEEQQSSDETNAGDMIKLLHEKMSQMRPKIELITFLSTKCLKTRHLRRLSDDAFAECGFLFRFSGKHNDVLTVVDQRGRDSTMGLGSLENLQLSLLWSRGISSQLEKIRDITAEAVMELMIECTLARIEDTVKSATLLTSTAWLRDSKLREKIFFELFQSVNLTQLSVLLQYCMKGTLMLEELSVDMSLAYFSPRIDSLRECLQRLDRFVESIREIQDKWYYVFHYVKFSPSSELDRDTSKAFQNCTEELKRIEMTIQQKSGNLRLACISLIEHENSIENCKQSLASIMEDAHSNIQSCLDGCPRLSLLSYSRLYQLITAWMLGPHHQLSLISDCFHDMFQGVYMLTTSINMTLRIHACTGFVSNDSAETIAFLHPIDFTLPLPDFVTQFEFQLRNVLVHSSDNLMLCRIQSIRSLLVDITAPSYILNNIDSLFNQRLQQLLHFACDEYPNQAFVLLNACMFAEDVWTCLGHPTGSLLLARPDLQQDFKLFASGWKTSLNKLIAVCKLNLQLLVDHLHGAVTMETVKPKKAKALLSSIFLQEVGFLRLAEKIYLSSCIESASELWAGTFQFKYLYKKEYRSKHCPFDVVLGCVTVVYGLEYQGGTVKIIVNASHEDVVQRVVSSAFSSNASIIVNREVDYSSTDASGEYVVTPMDVALLLGRMCVTLSSIPSAASARLFFSRLVYLDAVGCVDFSCLDSHSLQILTSTLSQYWKALETKNDLLFRENLKYPLQTKFGATDAQLQRKKDNLVSLRESIDFATKLRKYPGLLVVALASETLQYSDSSVFNYFSRDVFSVIAVPHSRPVEQLGLFLTLEGYKYGLEIQEVMTSTILKLKDKYSHMANLMACVSSSRFLRGLVSEAGKVLTLRANRLQSMNPGSERFKLELNCFAVILWECILVLGDEIDTNTQGLQADCVSAFEELYTELVKDSQVKVGAYLTSLHDARKVATASASGKLLDLEASYFSVKTKNSRFMVPKSIAHNIQALAKERGLWTGDQFIEYCASFWNLISSNSNFVTILSGPASCGKSSIRETVVDLVRKIGLYPDLPRSSIGPIRAWRAGFIIVRTIVSWYRSPLYSKWKHSRSRSPPVKSSHDDERQPFDATGAAEHTVRPRHYTIRAPVDAFTVKVNVIFHSSLSYEYLLGSFDASGRWRDGLLLRKIRQLDLGSKTSSTNRFDLFVLDGPLNHFIEQIFGTFYCQSHTSHGMQACEAMVFPNGEVYKIPSNVRFVLESDDLAQASPAIAVYLPHFHVSLHTYACYDRLLRVWVRSVKHWLDNFPPWREALEDLVNTLLCTELVSDLLLFADPESSSVTPTSSLIISRMGSFLRYLEALLGQCQDLAIGEATFNKPDGDSDSEDDDDDSRSVRSNVDNSIGAGEDFYGSFQSLLPEVRDLSKETMILGEHGREKLLSRSRLSLIYAAIWAFGGHLSQHKSRKVFDHVLRERVFYYFETAVIIPKEVTAFAMVLDLQGCALIEPGAVPGSVLTPVFELPQRLQHLMISVDRTPSRQGLTFRTPETIALDYAVRLLVTAGGLPLIVGPANCGKTSMVMEMLDDLKKNIQSPQQVQQHLLTNLLEILNERKEPQGEALALVLLRETLKKLGKSHPMVDSECTFATCWASVQDDIKLLAADEPGLHAWKKTVSGSRVSLGAYSTAEALKHWISREYSTEVKDCLETSRFSYGIIFIDDLHLCANEKSDFQRKFVDNRPEAVIKGLLSTYAPFGLKANMRVRMPNSPFTGPEDGSIPRSLPQRPTLHKNFLSDPRVLAETDDNYVMQRIGIISCASGNCYKVVSSPEFSQFLSHHGVFQFPVMSTSALHASLILGSYVALDAGSQGSKIVSTLKTEIIEMSNITISVCKRMVSSVDNYITTELEKSVRNIVQLDINLISKFCEALQLGSGVIANPGGLLQLFAHEWKRYFIDPFPLGTQRERFILLFKEELESIDYKRWYITKDWFEAVKSSFEPLIDRVWINPSTFSASATTAEVTTGANYLPMELVQSNNENLVGTVDSDNRLLDCTDLHYASDSFVYMMFPAAMSMILRMVRILSRGQHLLLSAFNGSLKHKGIRLAAKICGRKMFTFSSKDYTGTEMPPSSMATESSNFKRFLKSAVLCAAGFRNTKSDPEEATFDAYFQAYSANYEKLDGQNVVIVVSEAQQLSVDNRRMLLNLLDVNCACNLFEDHEIAGWFHTIE
jgi:hypothetical protein